MLSFDYKEQLSQFLTEDVGKKDITGDLLTRRRISARIISRESAVIAGTVHAREIFGLMKCSVRILKKDGSRTRPDQTVMTVTGDAGKILTCERTALNIMSRMSGIATQTDVLVKKIPKSVRLYATRKTAPGLRYFDKEAVEIGGGKRHRLRLDEMVMIKDNHIAVEGALLPLIKKARKRHKKFEVEVENTADAVMAAREGATAVMLDNFTPSQIRKTIGVLKREGLRNKIVLEASGGIRLGNISQYGRAGIDIISVGSITNATRGIDMSLEV